MVHTISLVVNIVSFALYLVLVLYCYYNYVLKKRNIPTLIVNGKKNTKFQKIVTTIFIVDIIYIIGATLLTYYGNGETLFTTPIEHAFLACNILCLFMDISFVWLYERNAKKNKTPVLLGSSIDKRNIFEDVNMFLTLVTFWYSGLLLVSSLTLYFSAFVVNS
jgi:hypothetical protein